MSEQREHLFKSKRAHNGEWIEGVPYDNFMICGMNLIWLDEEVPMSECPEFDYVEIDPETVGRYTGRTDKNGMKIFEGDILRCVSEYCDDTYITEVWAEGNTLCVDIHGYDFDYTAIDFAVEYWRNDGYEIEVIGNVHDNPELLEVKQNG